jgi:hypothetical protein
MEKISVNQDFLSTTGIQLFSLSSLKLEIKNNNKKNMKFWTKIEFSICVGTKVYNLKSLGTKVSFSPQVWNSHPFSPPPIAYTLQISSYEKSSLPLSIKAKPTLF